MEKIYNIDISKNKNGTSYSVTCSPLRIAATVHHHDLLWYLKELKKSYQERSGYKLFFSKYEDFWGDIKSVILTDS